jgi:hypothetical protein
MSKQTRKCSICQLDLPESHFGIVRSRPDGLNLRCKKCMRGVAKHHYDRERQRTYSISRKMRVLQAIQQGATTQEKIVSATRLAEDVVCDELARLWDEEKLNRVAMKQRIYLAA